MSIKLRPWQDSAINRALKWLVIEKKDKRFLINAAPGAGKTICASVIAKKLIEINKPKRNDAISVDPPRIYRVKLYGYRYMPWAYVNSLDIEMLGTKRMINGNIIPEAYSINIGFQPLTIEVSNFLDQA